MPTAMYISEFRRRLQAILKPAGLRASVRYIHPDAVFTIMRDERPITFNDFHESSIDQDAIAALLTYEKARWVYSRGNWQPVIHFISST